MDFRAPQSYHTLSHEKNFLEAVKAINKEVKRSVTSPQHYTKAAVLALRWSNDDLDLDPLKAALLQAFETRFGFKTSSFIIPSSSVYDAKMQTRTALNNFVNKYDGEKTLLVIFYGGRGAVTQTNLQIFGEQNPGSIRIPWGFVEICVVARGDVLFILDTCFSTGTVFANNIRTSFQRYSEAEYLSTSGFESPASADSINNFTHSVTNLLMTMPAPFTIAQLHGALMMKENDPQFRLELTPVYVAHPSKPSITLRALDAIPSEVQNLESGQDLFAGKVLISVRLQGHAAIPEVNHWKAWLSSAVPQTSPRSPLRACLLMHSHLCVS